MSARRPRTAGRRLPKGIEGSLDRDEDGGERSKQKKRKLSDLLGPPWTEDDLKKFYHAYRRHGRDWRKVAAMLHNRTVEMVEALYSVNKAYLSLPEGAASAAGLIAMMIDHFNILEESRSYGDESSEDMAGSDPSQQVPGRLWNRSSGMQPSSKSRVSVPPVVSGFSSYGGPSPAKKPRTTGVNRPRAVGKRTPRVPLMHLQDKKGSTKTVPMRQGEDLELETLGHCDEVQVARTLAAASRRVASPQISRTPACRTDHSKNPYVQNGYAKDVGIGVDSGGSATKHTGSNMDNGGMEGSEESKDTENGVVTKASTSTAVDGVKPAKKNSSPVGEVKSRLRRNQKPQTKEGKMQGFDSVRLDDLKEACSCTEEGPWRQDEKAVDGLKNEQGQKKKRLPSQKAKKRSRQLFSGDGSSGLDALATLADLSLNGLLPSPKTDLAKVLELSKDDKAITLACVAREAKGFEFEAFHEPSKDMDVKCVFTGGTKESLARLNSGHILESDTQMATSITEFKKRKRKGSAEKREQFSESNFGDFEDKAEAKAVQAHAVEPVTRSKLKRNIAGQNATKHIAKPAKQMEPPALDHGLDSKEGAPGESDMEDDTIVSIGTIPVKERARRKVVSERIMLVQASGLVDGKGENSNALLSSTRRAIMHCPHTSTAIGQLSNKVRLMHCLSSKNVRRWCIYEWFYSAIDLPWFARNEFVEYLNHAGLGHVPRLTRAEWGVIRGSLGKPRRLSKRFLQEEREKLGMYRDSVRRHYHEVRIGHRDGLATDLPRPLTVGQRVTARHPKTKEIHDGSVLTVDRNRCRVQFDRPEMGVELVDDIDCMPVNSSENLSEMIRRTIQVEGLDQSIEDTKHGIKFKIAATAGSAARAALNERLEKPTTLVGFNSSSKYFLSALCKQAQAADTVDSVIQVKAAANEAVAAAQQAMYNQPCTLAQVQAREADIRALADLTRALDKKEALLLELRNMNDDAALNQKYGAPTDMFQKQYATLLLQLKEVNQQVCGALLQLRQRNKYQENVLPPWHRSPLQQTLGLSKPWSLDCNAFSMEQFPVVRELAVHVKHDARLMVNTAMEAMISLAEGEDALSKIGNVLNLLEKTNISVPQTDGLKVDSAAAPIVCHVSSCFCTGSDPMTSIDYGKTGGVKQTSSNNADDTTVLAELMTTCVAALLMVQAFTERQFPPAEVAMAFESFLASLRPLSPENYAIYTEIEHYASLLKDQIIALVPTQGVPVETPN